LAENELRAYIPDSKLQKMQNIIFEIEKNYSDSQLSITDLSEMYGCSEAHFRRIFNQIYRISPQKYLSKLRLNKSKELLSDTALSINKIAESCGFSSAYYFDRVFKAENGVTPVQYRKRQKGK
jgi:transcriptional regulator GlxA family with amidase domain